MYKKNNIIENIKSTMAVEGIFLDDSDIDIINRFLKNEISEKQGIEEIKSQFNSLR